MQTFGITYQIVVSKSESIEQKVERICLEQSVELPRAVISESIAEKTVGEIILLEQVREKVYKAIIQWPLGNIAGEITQFLNLLYGNISLQPGIRIDKVAWNQLPGNLFLGPAFGIDILRLAFAVRSRALGATALKPMGSMAKELGERCYRFAKGGIDIIKDDHGLTNQSAAPFKKRVKACVAAIERAADETGRRSCYFPNITAPGPALLERYKMAAVLDADGVLVSPHLTGLPMMHELRKSDIPLPVMAHPAFSGSLVRRNNEGFTPAFLYGQLWRALGADFVIYPNAGGRFSFSQKQCRAINKAARTKVLPFNQSFPVPAGGLELETIAKWKKIYQKNTVFLMGGSLYKYPQGIEEAAKKFSGELKK